MKLCLVLLPCRGIGCAFPFVRHGRGSVVCRLSLSHGVVRLLRLNGELVVHMIQTVQDNLTVHAGLSGHVLLCRQVGSGNIQTSLDALDPSLDEWVILNLRRMRVVVGSRRDLGVSIAVD